MIPEDWSEKKLGELFDFKNGVNTEAANYGSGVKFVNVMDIFGNNILTSDKIKGQVNLPAEKTNLYLLKSGDVLFNRTSEVFDEIALSAVYLDTKPAVFGGFVIRGRPNSEELDPKYCIYCFSSYKVRKELIRRGQGAIRANIGQADMRHVPLLVPPINEQTKIANILTIWDKAIETVEKLIENSRAQKKALMQQLLTGRKRFPQFNGKWKEVLLGNISDITTGNSNRQDSHLNGKYTFFDRSEDIRTSDRYLFDCEAVIVPGEGQNFIPKYFVGKFDLHQRTYAIMEFRECIGKFIYYVISFFTNHLLSHAVGSTVKSLRLPMFQKMKIMLPTEEEQQKIQYVLSNTDEEIITLQQKLVCLQQEKKALMQQLLTGKRRVKIENEQVTEIMR